MDSLTNNPVLGHINTFGGHPVCCAAGLAAMQVLLQQKIIDTVYVKQKLFLSLLTHPKIKNVKSCGLMIAVEFKNAATNKKVIDALIDDGIFTDWFLFAPECLRIVPPLIITEDEIRQACSKIISVLNTNISE
jgi:acetylornithine/succinyldiaminopimelate/putrescine aminotransferase